MHVPQTRRQHFGYKHDVTVVVVETNWTAVSSGHSDDDTKKSSMTYYFYLSLLLYTVHGHCGWNSIQSSEL